MCSLQELRFWFEVLKECFPLVGTLGHEWVPERTPEGAERSGALGGFAESCACGLSWHNRPAEGELNQMFSVISRRGCDYTKEDATDYRRGCD